MIVANLPFSWIEILCKEDQKNKVEAVWKKNKKKTENRKKEVVQQAVSGVFKRDCQSGLLYEHQLQKQSGRVRRIFSTSQLEFLLIPLS